MEQSKIIDTLETYHPYAYEANTFKVLTYMAATSHVEGYSDEE